MGERNSVEWVKQAAKMTLEILLNGYSLLNLMYTFGYLGIL